MPESNNTITSPTGIAPENEPADAPIEPVSPAFAFLSLRARLVAIILLALLPAFLLLLVVSNLERTRARAVAADQTLAVSRLLRNQYRELVQNNHVLLQWATQTPPISEGTPAECNARVARLFATLDEYRGMSVANADGQVFCIAAPVEVPLPLDNSDATYFRRVSATRDFVVTGVEIGRFSGVPYLSFALPVLDEAGEVTRVIALGADIQAMNDRLLGADFPEQAAILVVDASGGVILRNPLPEAFRGDRFPIEELKTDPTATEGTREMSGLDGVERLYSYTQVTYHGEIIFYLLVGYSSEMIYGGAARTLRASLIGLGIVSLIALAAAWSSAETMIVRRIKLLAAAAARMSDGDLTTRTGIAGDKNEFGQLAATLDSLAAGLEQRRIDNERLISEMSAMNADLEQRVEKRTQQLVATISKLRESQGELRRLSQDLMRATEVERARISREIHDQVGQMLTAIKMELRTAKRRLADPPETRVEQVEAKLGDISTMLDEMVILVRRISADLRPGILDDFGLQAAVEWQLQEFEKNTGISYNVDAVVDEERVSPALATAAFRILQEALTNVARHAEATRVSVEVTTDDETLTMVVRDNGKGIAPEKLIMSRSLGLLGMRERAAELGGTVLIVGGAEGGAESMAEGGTRLTLHAPLDPANARQNGEKQNA